MKKNFLLLAVGLFCYLLLISCNMATPENYFDRAVLNANMQFGFAGVGLLRQFESPSAKMDEKTKEPVPMLRSEVVGGMIHFAEEALEKVKALKQTADTKDILENSIAFHEFVIPVYKNEYTQLAKLYDAGAPKEQVDKQADLIRDKYLARYEELYNKLIMSGKLYAEKNNIKVNWGVYGN